MKRMNRLLLAAPILLAANASLAVSGEADSFCLNENKAPVTEYWQVDDELSGELNALSFGVMNISYTELVNAVDQALQAISRHSRVEIRARVVDDIPSDCTGEDATPCIIGIQDDVCVDNPGFKAHAACAPGVVCHVVFCVENIAADGTDMDWTSDRSLIKFLTHELGHAYGMSHSNGPCSTSDGCEGEIMCNGGAGRLESLHLGNQESGSAICF